MESILLMGTSSVNGLFSIAMLNDQRVFDGFLRELCGDLILILWGSYGNSWCYGDFMGLHGCVFFFYVVWGLVRVCFECIPLKWSFFDIRNMMIIHWI